MSETPTKAPKRTGAVKPKPVQGGKNVSARTSAQHAATADGADRPLTDKQARLVEAFAAAAAAGVSISQTEAGQAAGYEGDNLHIVVSSTLRKPHVRAALMARLRDVMTTDIAPLALARFKSLISKADKDSVSLTASTRALEAANILVPQSGIQPGGVRVAIQINAPGFGGGAYSVHLADRLDIPQASQGVTHHDRPPTQGVDCDIGEAGGAD